MWANQVIRKTFGQMPKYIDPKTHAVVDYLTAGACFMVAALTWRRRRRASVAAIINGAAVLGTSMLTDYPGGVAKVISFPTHGKIDVAQAGVAAAMPKMMGFSNRGISWFFEGLAMG